MFLSPIMIGGIKNNFYKYDSFSANSFGDSSQPVAGSTAKRQAVALVGREGS